MEEPKLKPRDARIQSITPEITHELVNKLKKDILISHPEERMLWLQQRIAGTNEQWRTRCKNSLSGGWNDISVHKEPRWLETHEYEVKPKTVKYYFCVSRREDGSIGVFGQLGTKDELESSATFGGATIIGNIEERDVEV